MRILKFRETVSRGRMKVVMVEEGVNLVRTSVESCPLTNAGFEEYEV